MGRHYFETKTEMLAMANAIPMTVAIVIAKVATDAVFIRMIDY